MELATVFGSLWRSPKGQQTYLTDYFPLGGERLQRESQGDASSAPPCSTWHTSTLKRSTKVLLVKTEIFSLAAYLHIKFRLQHCLCWLPHSEVTYTAGKPRLFCECDIQWGLLVFGIVEESGIWDRGAGATTQWNSLGFFKRSSHCKH